MIDSFFLLVVDRIEDFFILEGVIVLFIKELMYLILDILGWWEVLKLVIVCENVERD